MDNAITHAKHDEYPHEIVESVEDVLISSVDKPHTNHFWVQKLCTRHMCGLNKKIPKQIMILEEKVLRYCLELMHTSGSKDNLWIIPSKMNLFPQCFSSVVSSRIGCDSSLLISFRDPITGSITMNALNNQLIRFEETGTLEAKESGLLVGSSHGRILPEDQKFVSESLHKRVIPLPRIDSSGAYDRGMLQCSWTDGFPSYVFSMESKRKVFITTKVSDKGADYVYMFHSREKESGFHLHLLGEMRVSTSFELCPHGTETMETRFVLCVHGDDLERDDPTRGKNKGLSNVFRSRPRSFSVQENLVDPKLELAAIVLKDKIRDSRDRGGWGLKFLRNDDHCESCRENASMNVVVPAGFHGGPRSRSGGGPSSLVERWRNGGSCDCGGWDLGCPLTLLHAKLNHPDGGFVDNVAFDLFIQGRKGSVPVLKMVNVGAGLYDLRYKSCLSPLQSISIAVAAIHGRCSMHNHQLKQWCDPS